MKLALEQVNNIIWYQFLIDDLSVTKKLTFLNNISLDNKVYNYYYYFKKIEYIIENIIIKKLNTINNWYWAKVWVLLSWWVDSFLLLYYLRKNFKDLDIYTFSFFSENEKYIESKLRNLSTLFKTFHTNYVKDFTFYSILSELKALYSNTNGFEWDSWYFIYSYFFKKIKKDFPYLKYIFSWEGIDVLFWWLSMYRLSYLENQFSSIVDTSFFRDKYEEKYFYKTSKKYEKSFFYKYWEYFWFSLDNDMKNIFYRYYDFIDSSRYDTLLKKQVVFNLWFFVENRKNYIFKSWALYDLNIIVPFIDDSFVYDIIKLNIPDKFLLNFHTTKKVIRDIWYNILNNLDKDLYFFEIWKVNFNKIFLKDKDIILKIWKYLFLKWYISKKYYLSLSCIIENSMRYENQIRIYTLINLYSFIKFSI